MTNKRVSFEQKIKEIVDRWDRIDIYKIQNTDQYIVSSNNKDWSTAKVWNDLWRSLTNLYNIT